MEPPRDGTVDADVEPPLADGVVNAEPARAAALNRRVGLFLPYTPLHHLLLEGLGRPIVLTSGNLSDEPLATDDAEALERLAGIADSFLAHDREIRARYDDSVTRVVDGRESLIRRGRGYAPEPLALPIATPRQRSGGGRGAQAHFHAGPRGSGPRGAAHRRPRGPADASGVRRRTWPTWSGCSTSSRRTSPTTCIPATCRRSTPIRHFPESRRIPVQHHHAHVASAAAEAGLTGEFIGVAFDGLGMGDDGTFWGGEVLVATLAGYRRVGRFGRAPMPGGALAVKKPYRMALGYLMAAEAFEQEAPAGRPASPIGSTPS